MKSLTGSSALILVILFGVSLLGEVDYQTIPPLLPLLSNAFHVDPGYAGRVVTVYALSAAFATLFFGIMSDHYGRKPFIQLGLFSFSASTLLTGLTGSMNLFLLVRFVTGMTAGAFTVCVTSYAADYFQYEHRGRAMGVLSAAYFAAAIIGIPSATLLASAWGWRSIYWINSGLALILGLVVSQWLVHTPSARVSSRSIGQLRIKELRNGMVTYAAQSDILALLAGSLVSSGATVGFITYLGSYLHQGLHISMRQVGGVFLGCGLASLLGAPLSGILSDHFGKKTLLILGGAVLACGMVVIPLLGWGIWLWIGLGLAGISMAFRMAPLLALLSELADPSDRGTLLALRSTLSQLGIATISLASSYCYLFKGYRGVGILTGFLTGLSTLLVVLLVKEPGRESSSKGTLLV
jgi:predicted MFS family arabinose efflux permease